MNKSHNLWDWYGADMKCAQKDLHMEGLVYNLNGV
jgi:hypothetical protein